MKSVLNFLKKSNKEEDIRSSKRVSTNIVGSLDTSRDSYLIRMNNLSKEGACIICPAELNDKSYLMIRGIYIMGNCLEVSEIPRGAIIIREEKMRNGIRMGIKFLDQASEKNSFEKIYSHLLQSNYLP